MAINIGVPKFSRILDILLGTYNEAIIHVVSKGIQKYSVSKQQHFFEYIVLQANSIINSNVVNINIFAGELNATEEFKGETSKLNEVVSEFGSFQLQVYEFERKGNPEHVVLYPSFALSSWLSFLEEQHETTIRPWLTNLPNYFAEELASKEESNPRNRYISILFDNKISVVMPGFNIYMYKEITEISTDNIKQKNISLPMKLPYT